MKKYKLLNLLLILLVISCNNKQAKVSKNHNIYEQDLKDSLSKKDLKRSSYILGVTPDIKTLDYYTLVIKYHKLNNSLEEYDELIQKESNIFVKEYMKGLRNFSKGIYFFDKALINFNNCMRYQDKFNYSKSELYYNISILESKKDNFKNSLSMIDKAINIENREKYIVFKAYLLYELGSFIESRNILNSNFQNINNTKNANKARILMIKLEHSFNPIPKSVMQGYQAWLNIVKTGKQTSVVLSAAKKGIEEFPLYSQMYTLAGLASFFIDRKNDAINYFRKAIILDENISFNYMQLGIIYNSLKLPIKSKNILEKALEYNKYVPIIYSYLSKLELELGNKKMSLERKLEQLKFGDSFEAYMDLIKLYQIKPLEEQKKLIKKVIKLYPEEPKPYRMMVTLFNKLIDAEKNPDIKYNLKKEQSSYNEKYEDKSFEKSKKRLVDANKVD